MEASNGAEAVALANVAGPDLIILDLRMPVMTGFEALAALRSEPCFATPVVAATAFAMDGDCERAMEAGFTAHITKPFRLAEFRLLVAKLLEEPRGAAAAN